MECGCAVAGDVDVSGFDGGLRGDAFSEELAGVGPCAGCAVDVGWVEAEREFEGVAAAVDLLLKHRTGRVLIVGDFDADGATSTALIAPNWR